MKRAALVIPPTRTNRQLAAWINTTMLVDDRGLAVGAVATPIKTSTDTRVAGTRLRRPGRGRRGVLLEIWLLNPDDLPEACLYRHESSQTYRRHEEARVWVAQNLRRQGPR
jgi:hypothetical protein